MTVGEDFKINNLEKVKIKIVYSSYILYLVSMLLSARVLGQKWTPAQGLENPTLNYIHYIASKAVWGIFL